MVLVPNIVDYADSFTAILHAKQYVSFAPSKKVVNQCCSVSDLNVCVSKLTDLVQRPLNGRATSREHEDNKSDTDDSNDSDAGERDPADELVCREFVTTIHWLFVKCEVQKIAVLVTPEELIILGSALRSMPEYGISAHVCREALGAESTGKVPTLSAAPEGVIGLQGTCGYSRSQFVRKFLESYYWVSWMSSASAVQSTYGDSEREVRNHFVKAAAKLSTVNRTGIPHSQVSCVVIDNADRVLKNRGLVKSLCHAIDEFVAPSHLRDESHSRVALVLIFESIETMPNSIRTRLNQIVEASGVT